MARATVPLCKGGAGVWGFSYSNARGQLAPRRLEFSRLDELLAKVLLCCAGTISLFIAIDNITPRIHNIIVLMKQNMPLQVLTPMVVKGHCSISLAGWKSGFQALSMK